MISADQYIFSLRADYRRGRCAAVLNAPALAAGDSFPELLRRIAVALDRAGDESRLLGTVRDLEGAIEMMASDLQDDAISRVPPDDRIYIENSVVAFLPTSLVAAFVDDHDHFGQRLDRPIVGINYAIFVVAFMLADCMIWESLQGESAHLQRDATEIFHDSVYLFREQSLDRWTTKESWADSPEQYESISSLGGKIAAQLLHFITLHELAHLRLNHLSQRSWRLGMTENGVKQIAWLGDSTPVRYAQELEADALAARWLLASSSAEGAWPNITMAYLFMHWLAAVEQNLDRRLDSSYPLPQDRAAQLLRIASETLNQPRADCFDLVDRRMAFWRQGL